MALVSCWACCLPAASPLRSAPGRPSNSCSSRRSEAAAKAETAAAGAAAAGGAAAAAAACLCSQARAGAETCCHSSCAAESSRCSKASCVCGCSAMLQLSSRQQQAACMGPWAQRTSSERVDARCSNSRAVCYARRQLPARSQQEERGHGANQEKQRGFTTVSPCASASRTAGRWCAVRGGSAVDRSWCSRSAVSSTQSELRSTRMRLPG